MPFSYYNPWQDAAAFGRGLGDTLSQVLLQLPRQRAELAIQQQQVPFQRAMQLMQMQQMQGQLEQQPLHMQVLQQQIAGEKAKNQAFADKQKSDAALNATIARYPSMVSRAASALDQMAPIGEALQTLIPSGPDFSSLASAVRQTPLDVMSAAAQANVDPREASVIAHNVASAEAQKAAAVRYAREPAGVHAFAQGTIAQKYNPLTGRMETIGGNEVDPTVQTLHNLSLIGNLMGPIVAMYNASRSTIPGREPSPENQQAAAFLQYLMGLGQKTAGMTNAPVVPPPTSTNRFRYLGSRPAQ